MFFLTSPRRRRHVAATSPQSLCDVAAEGEVALSFPQWARHKTGVKAAGRTESLPSGISSKDWDAYNRYVTSLPEGKVECSFRQWAGAKAAGANAAGRADSQPSGISSNDWDAYIRYVTSLPDGEGCMLLSAVGMYQSEWERTGTNRIPAIWNVE